MCLLRPRFAEKWLGFALQPLVLLAALGSPAAGQEEDEQSPYRPGLAATYAVGGKTATRTDEVLAFDWQDAACEERLPAGEFTATWRGRLWARGSGTYRLQCYVQGEVAIRIAGKQVISGEATEPRWLVSEPQELEFDDHPLEITFRKTQAKAQLALFWSGPDFQLEPVPARALVHEREQTPSAEFERGRQLAAALRCAACHADQAAAVAPAPALDRLSGNIERSWIVEWLSGHTEARENDGKGALRRMPDLAMTRGDAEAVAAWLLREPAMNVEPKNVEQKETKGTKSSEKGKKADGKGGKKAREEKPQPSVEEGERLILTRGCLACHQLGKLGESGLFGGGDLTDFGKKRPSDFLKRWLSDPGAINRHQRMPIFTFTADELASLSLWGKKQATNNAASNSKPQQPGELVRQGEKLISSLRCAACHAVASDQAAPQPLSLKPLAATSDWSQACVGLPARDKQRPGYRLATQDQSALKAYYSQPRPGEEKLSPQARGRDLLVQHNCLACHQREGVERATHSLPALLQDKLVAVAEAHGELAPLVPAMTPPALNSVGDKLHDAALVESISREGQPHRPYLLVQMPKFKLTQEELGSLTAYFTASDRIPRRIGVPPVIANGTGETPILQAGETPTPRLLAAGPRLVTADGLACTSCHAVGSVQPAKAPLNARGPDLSMLDKRIRREWFDRWCDNPARIVPRMEMPSVKVPVRGVLNDNVHDQLAAVWHILNTPGFEPPEPNPVRVLRLSGIPEKNELPIVIHDVVKYGDKTYLFPLVIGLPNRHNILFDLETNRLAAWWLGDTARQRTKGKSWYWEVGGKSILPQQAGESDLSFQIDGKIYAPHSRGQFVVERVNPNGYGNFRYRFTVANEQDTREIYFDQSFSNTFWHPRHVNRPNFPTPNGITGFTRTLRFSLVKPLEAVRLRLVSAEAAAAGRWNDDTKTFEGLSDGELSIGIRGFHSKSQVTWNGDGTVTWLVPKPQPPWSLLELSVVYFTTLPVDTFPSDLPGPVTTEASSVQIAPGFEGQRLPLPMDIMPSGLHWIKDDLLFVTLKGQLYSAKDTNQDGSEDVLTTLVDGLATPYGLNSSLDSQGMGFATTSKVLVAAKDAVLKIDTQSPTDGYGEEPRRVAAAGWGYTDDYHDWTVGLVRGTNAECFIALPCQQDQRSEAAAMYRGKVLKLVQKKAPPKKDANDVVYVETDTFDIEVISAGHRFPMGMARNREGELFVTDNQGNYNPFNELNHVRKGAHFGFINALEKEQGFQPPPLSEPAIDIPHPWTRSVNGICFLDTPVEHASSLVPDAEQAGTLALRKSIYGPLEGHLIGCEYDTRRLIRMSLQKMGDTYQGCAYPLSIPTEDVEKGLLGPIVCAIKPTTGELYVGEIRDSGWGAANNIGQIVKIKIEPEKLPCGIAEVRATHTGFTIDFFQPVDRAKAAEIGSYTIASYRRESTPAYGGADIDRRTERVNSVAVSPDGKRVMLSLADLRAGHLYELKLKNLTPGGGMFHPDEAHYTLRRVPE
jgi:mono/diheme cytochrome c family protein